MLFNSYIFILLFLPLCLAGYFGLHAAGKPRWAQLFLLGMSLWFYGYFHPGYLAIILSSVLVNYAAYLLIRRSAGAAAKVWMIAGVAVNLAILGYFKYMDFFISTANAWLRTDFPLLGILLPLGISFFTFQQVSFVVDTYWGETEAYDFLEYACFVTYFPQLIAGPIVTHDELIPQFRDQAKRSVNWDNMAMGFFMFAMGLTKKVLLADTLGNVANYGFSDVSQLDSTAAVITMLAYTLQIYLDFSGYCDMAIGIGKMMNIDLPVNFNSPYKALTITDFWDRWHMTLTRFFTRYVYIPLGGSRQGKARTYRNVLIVFFLSGFWHGAGFTFLVWGLLHGLLSVLTRMCRGVIARIPGFVNWAVTFLFVNISWVFFRAASMEEAVGLLKRAAECRFGPLNEYQVNAMILPEIREVLNYLPWMFRNERLIFAGSFLAALLLVLFTENAHEKMEKFRPSARNAVISALLIGWCVFSLSGVSTFLYFNF